MTSTTVRRKNYARHKIQIGALLAAESMSWSNNFVAFIADPTKWRNVPQANRTNYNCLKYDTNQIAFLVADTVVRLKMSGSGQAGVTRRARSSERKYFCRVLDGILSRIITLDSCGST